MAGSARYSWALALLAIALTTQVARGGDAPSEPKADPRPETVIGWVSDGNCGAKHMKTGGAACVRKCIAGAEHINPEWKASGMVFVTEDKQLWRVDNADALWGHESEQLEILAFRNSEKKSIKVKEIVKVLQK
jgi:hypothetical protein